MNKNKDLGIIASQLSNNEETLHLVQFAQDYTKNNPYNQICFFNSFCDMVSSPGVPILHLSQAKFFYGNLFVTNIQDAELCLNFPNIYKILFFASSLPWTEQLKNYRYWENIFLNNKVNIIANNQKIYDIFKLCYKQPICLSERLSYETIQEYI